MRFKKNGFTLIEMLVVIAIIAVLVSIIVPVVSSSTEKAKAATDASNLRAVLGLLNVEVVNGGKTVPEIIEASANPTSKLDPGAVLKVVYDAPGFIDVYYVNGETYYGLKYLSDVAENGESSLSTARPTVDGTWYTAGDSADNS
ncbi:MAG: type II secretion system protein [Faecousia sp.]